MSELEEKLNALLSNPQLMQQIASMAQAMDSNPPEKAEPQMPAAPALDPQLIQTMAQTLGNTGVDNNQKALLHALRPYLSAHRVQKLERAMQAAKTARLASDLIGSGALSNLIGR